MMRVLALALAVWAAAPLAGAQDRASAPARERGSDVEQDELLTSHREVPDLDGRDAPGPDAGEVLIWIPRVLFSPITLVLDYGLRRPLGWLLTTAEREGWIDFLLDVFTWNERRSMLLPTFYLASGAQPTVGLSLSSNDDIAPGHSIGASFAFGGVDTTYGGATYSIRSPAGVRVDVRGSGGQRPDRVFSGIGWDATEVQYRFREAWYDAGLGLRADLWRQSRIELRSGVDGHEYDPNGYAGLSDSPSLAEGIASNAIERPPGLDEGFVASRSRIAIALDSRELEPAPGHGVRVEGYGELVIDLVDPLQRRWVRYGGGVGGFVDLGARRVLALWGVARFSDPLGPGEVPFTELVALGDQTLLLQGFLRGQLRGRTGVASTLEYVYPIWTRLDARLHVAVGNAFGAHLEDFRLERLRMSFGMGLSTNGDPDRGLHFGVAAGTAPFVEGASIDSVQVVLGTRRGF